MVGSGRGSCGDDVGAWKGAAAGGTNMGMAGAGEGAGQGGDGEGEKRSNEKVVCGDHRGSGVYR